MSFESRVVKNAQTVEYGKFVELVGDSRFPAVSVTRIQYRDTSDAFPNNKGLPPLTSVEIYPKFAVITYNVNPGSGYTMCETRTSGNPSFISSKIFIHNLANSTTNVKLTLTSGLSCNIPIGKNAEPNHIYTENLAVSGVNDYGGCSINFYA